MLFDINIVIHLIIPIVGIPLTTVILDHSKPWLSVTIPKFDPDDDGNFDTSNVPATADLTTMMMGGPHSVLEGIRYLSSRWNGDKPHSFVENPVLLLITFGPPGDSDLVISVVQ